MKYKLYSDVEMVEYQHRTRLLAIVAALLGLVALYLGVDLVQTRHEIRGLTGQVVALEQSINRIIDVDKLLIEEENR